MEILFEHVLQSDSLAIRLLQNTIHSVAISVEELSTKACLRNKHLAEGMTPDHMLSLEFALSELYRSMTAADIVQAELGVEDKYLLQRGATLERLTLSFHDLLKLCFLLSETIAECFTRFYLSHSEASELLDALTAGLEMLVDVENCLTRHLPLQ